MNKQIAIDGPAGAGKSTIARLVAKQLGWIYVDTGAMYRAIALYMTRNGIDSSDKESITAALDNIDVSLSFGDEGQNVLLNGENVNGFIRNEEVSAVTSKISVYPEVRNKLTLIQKSIAESENVVMDGRDIGTSVLPDATLKIFLTAGEYARAKRRALEYEAKGKTADIEEIMEDIRLRDERDYTRSVSPLRQAEDAVLIDSSDMSIDEVVNTIISLYNANN
ncbi:MAG: (d)CMP kinase [Clostridiales bacterium]|nr:(d)CMP kinase [Clostridiales bacterium]